MTKEDDALSNLKINTFVQYLTLLLKPKSNENFLLASITDCFYFL